MTEVGRTATDRRTIHINAGRSIAIIYGFIPGSQGHKHPCILGLGRTRYRHVIMATYV